MMIPGLHKQRVALDRGLHRGLRMRSQAPDWTVAKNLNSIPVVASEFGDLCREYPLLFVRAGNDDKGQTQVAPIAAFGLSAQENLFLDGPLWRAACMPAALVAYPFSIARVDNQARALCIDRAWPGFSNSEGDALFNPDGSLGAHLLAMQKQLDQFDIEAQRTSAVCHFLVERELLREMRFDAELPGGKKLRVDGFLAVDQAKVTALPDADVLAMHRNGMLGLIHAHFISMANMRKLAQWRAARAAAG